MKTYKLYILGLWLTATMAAACSNQEPMVFGEADNGVYFNYETTSQLNMDVNMAERLLDIDRETGKLSQTVKLKLLGRLSEGERRAILKVKEVEGQPLADVEVPEVYFAAGEYEKDIIIKINRPAEEGIVYGACVYLDADDPKSQLGSGVSGFGAITLTVHEEYEQPSAWFEWSPLDMYFGAWNKEKQIFLTYVTEDPAFITYDWGQYNKLLSYNAMAVDSIRNFYQENPSEELPYQIPITTEVYDYEKPYYWGDEQDKFFGAYQCGNFTKYCNIPWPAVNTSNEKDYFTADVVGRNKEFVYYMAQQYNQFFRQGQWTDGYQWSIWVPMLMEEVNYDALPAPAAWEDELSRPTVEKYYGEYSMEKYQFMLLTASRTAAESGSDFCCAHIFPIHLEDLKDEVTGDYLGSVAKVESEENFASYNNLFRQADATGKYNFPTISE